MKPAMAAVFAVVVLFPESGAAATASQREYRRGYADCAAGRWDANQHADSYKKGCRAAEDKRGAAPAVAKPVRHRLTRNDKACIGAVRKVTRNSKVVHLGTETSQASDSVMIGVGSQLAKWRCLVSGGKVLDVQSLTDEGKL